MLGELPRKNVLRFRSFRGREAFVFEDEYLVDVDDIRVGELIVSRDTGERTEMPSAETDDECGERIVLGDDMPYFLLYRAFLCYRYARLDTLG